MEKKKPTHKIYWEEVVEMIKICIFIHFQASKKSIRYNQERTNGKKKYETTSFFTFTLILMKMKEIYSRPNCRRHNNFFNLN